MTNIASIFFSNTIVAFIILIGVVVFVHELGHFLAGKAFGILAEEFSIGFGPKAFSIKKGGTEYRINWLPLGGYVRFYGADIEEKIPLEMQEKSFLHAKVYKRAIVSFAGPFANFVLSFFIISTLCIYGIPEQQAIVSVLPNSVAQKAGLQTGDKVLQLDHKNINNWAELSEMISHSPNKKIDLTLERDGKTKNIQIVPSAEQIETMFGNEELVGRVGVSTLFESPHPVILKNSFLSTLGLKTGDKIVSFNHQKIDYLYQFTKALKSEAITRPVVIGVEREGAASPISIRMDPGLRRGDNVLSADQTIAGFSELSANDKFQDAQKAWKSCGLQAGDTLYSIADFGKISSYVQFLGWLEKTSKMLTAKATTPGTLFPVSLTVLTSQGDMKSLSCKIPVRKGYDSLNRENSYLDFPVTFVSQSLSISPTIVKIHSVTAIVQKSFSYVFNQIKLTYNGIKMLVTGHIPLSNLGGPIAIANAAGDAAKGGFFSFLFVMSFISTNIGFMNLLPLPALDGGSLLLQAVEAAYGKPLPKRVQIAVQRVGIFFLLGLFILVFYNDILRLIRF